MSLPLLFVAALYFLNPLTLSVYPQLSGSPATFRFLVIVPRDATNRHLCYGYSRDGLDDRKSCLSLDGAKAKRAYWTYWHIRTAGEYTATAILTRMEDGREKTYASHQPFRVVGGMEP